MIYNLISKIPRNNWSKHEVYKIFNMPLMSLLHESSKIHRQNFDPLHIQKSTLISIKTGGCPENCGYCSQSQHNKTFVKPTKQLGNEEILKAAKLAKMKGSTRFCMGAAWRGVGNKKSFERLLDVVKEIDKMGMEVCTTLGMIDVNQAKKLKDAGLTAYNHNLDTSRDYYPKIITTRSYDDRLKTLDAVRGVGLHVCTGGIFGLGETVEDRIDLLHTLCTLPGHPESVPINTLVPIKGTPVGDKMQGNKVDWEEILRIVASARILMPKSRIRLSAGRKDYSESEQTLMFMAGANSIFSGDNLLTTPNNAMDEDEKLFDKIGVSTKSNTNRKKSGKIVQWKW